MRKRMYAIRQQQSTTVEQQASETFVFSPFFACSFCSGDPLTCLQRNQRFLLNQLLGSALSSCKVPNKQSLAAATFLCERRKSNTRLRQSNTVIMRPSSLGGGRILRRTLSVCLSVCLSVRLSVCILSVRLSVRPSRYCFCLFYFTVEPSYERTSKIEKNFGFRLWASVTYVLLGTRRGPHIVRPSRPHKLVLLRISST